MRPGRGRASVQTDHAQMRLRIARAILPATASHVFAMTVSVLNLRRIRHVLFSFHSGWKQDLFRGYWVEIQLHIWVSCIIARFGEDVKFCFRRKTQKDVGEILWYANAGIALNTYNLPRAAESDILSIILFFVQISGLKFTVRGVPRAVHAEWFPRQAR